MSKKKDPQMELFGDKNAVLKNIGMVSDSPPPVVVDTREIKQMPKETVQMLNSLTGLLDGLTSGNVFYSQQISQVDTLFQNNRWIMLSNMRQLLSQIYVEHGVVQTLVDQPVDDAFRHGYKIKSQQLDEDEVQELERDNERDDTNKCIIQAAKWNRLFGGAGIMAITGQDPLRELSELKEGDLLKFESPDLWELFYNKQNYAGEFSTGKFELDVTAPGFLFNYYGIDLNPTRVFLLKGKEPPSFVRPRLRGWGMSELERLVRSLNSYLKNQDLVFELLDEAKVDAYKIMGFNSSLATAQGTRAIQERIQLSNTLKSYNNALVMDTQDEWDQKQMTFTGLSDMYIMLKQAVAADLKMPMTKLFGMSAAGFNSGEDDIENYNSMVESEIRSKIKPAIIWVNQLKCQKLFGYAPEDLEIEFPPLRILSAKEEEEVKTSKANRIVVFFNAGLISPLQSKQAINKSNLLDIKIDEDDELFENPLSFGIRTQGDDESA